MTPSTPADPLEKLWCGIVDNTTDQSFWIAEILLHGITKETGYCGPGRPSTADLELAERIEKAIVVSLMQQPDDPGPLWAMPLPYFEQARIVAALRNSAPQETRGDEPVGDFYLVPREIIDQFPEININNYDHDDSCALNAWGCDVVTNSNPAAASQQSPRLEREGIKVAVRSGFVKFGLVAVRELVDAIADAILALRSPDTTVVSSTHQGDPQSPANHVIKDISDDALFNIATEAWSTQTDHSWSSDGLEAAILAVRSAVETAPPASSTARGEGK